MLKGYTDKGTDDVYRDKYCIYPSYFRIHHISLSIIRIIYQNLYPYQIRLYMYINTPLD